MINMEEAFNLNTEDQLNPLCINVLNEIMMEWFNRPPPLDSCALGANLTLLEKNVTPFFVIWFPSCDKIRLWRERNWAMDIGAKEFSSLGTNVGLMFHICQPLFWKG